MERSKETPRYEGSHVFIFDPKDPTRIVLATNSYIGYIGVPGWGHKGDMGFEDAAKRYVKEQTGLDVYDLELLGDPWDNEGEPFEERSGLVQDVLVHNYLARRVEPEDIQGRIDQHRETEQGRKYKPMLVDIEKLPEIEGLAEETIGIVQSIRQNQ